MRNYPMQTVLAATAISLTLLATPAIAQSIWYVAPEGSSTSNSDGSRSAPFLSIYDALQSSNFQPGDTILLMDGNHGTFRLWNYYYDRTVTIQAENPHKAHLDWVLFQGNTSNITLRNLAVWPRDPKMTVQHGVVDAHGGTSHITVDGVEVRSHPDSSNYRNWSSEDWKTLRRNGIHLSGAHSAILNSTTTGIANGITTYGSDSRMIGNQVFGFAADGMRALGNNSLVQGNYVADCVNVDGNHDDGFQSWTTNGPQIGLTLDSNRILEWTGAPDHPLRCSLQGIGLFDGVYQDLKILNNVVAISHWHGISVYGAENAYIANNTVVNIDGISDKAPWLMIHPHSASIPSRNVVVANNVAMHIRIDSTTENATVVNNTEIRYPHAMFQDIQAFDYRPRLDSGLIDTGDLGTAPPVDILGSPRPQGAGPDRGAYEIGDEDATFGETDPTLIDVVNDPVDTIVDEPIAEVDPVPEPIAEEPSDDSAENTSGRPVRARGRNHKTIDDMGDTLEEEVTETEKTNNRRILPKFQ